jgi:hypothetical protein
VLAHQGSSWRVDDGDCRWKQAQFRRFQRVAAKGIDEFPAIEDELVQFLWPGCFPCRAGSLELNGVASDGLQRRQESTVGARVLSPAETGERERKWCSPRVPLAAGNVL